MICPVGSFLYTSILFSPGNRNVYVGLFSVIGARWPSGLERWLGMAPGHFRPGSNPTSVKTFRFGTLAIPFTPLCQCLSDETVKAVGPFSLVSMPGQVKDPTSPHWNV